MARDERIGMLTKTERDRIAEYAHLGPVEKKNLNFKLKKRLSEMQQSLADINLMLKQLPEDTTKEYIGTDTLLQALEVTENILKILNPWPIGIHEDGSIRVFRVFGNATPSNNPGECIIDSISRTASDEEIKLNRALKERYDRIRYFFDPCTPDPICHDPNYIGMQGKKAFEIANAIKTVTGETAHVSNDSYIDKWIEEGYQYVHKKPSVMTVEQLPLIRWKPRGLKDCVQLPEIRGPKKLPEDTNFTEYTINLSKNEPCVLVSEKGKTPYYITLEEYRSITQKDQPEDKS